MSGSRTAVVMLLTIGERSLLSNVAQVRSLYWTSGGKTKGAPGYGAPRGTIMVQVWRTWPYSFAALVLNYTARLGASTTPVLTSYCFILRLWGTPVVGADESFRLALPIDR